MANDGASKTTQLDSSISSERSVGHLSANAKSLTNVDRPVIVILIGPLWPGHEAAGPNISIRAMCKSLCEKYDFRIIARDRPFGAVAPLAANGVWYDIGFAQISYLTVGRFGPRNLLAYISEQNPSLIILNSFFDPEFTLPVLLARRIGRFRGIPCIISPRGEFSKGALSLKRYKKAVFRTLAKSIGLHAGIHIHATSDEEVSDCVRALPDHPVSYVDNFRELFDLPLHISADKNGPIRLIFIGRISPVKGLDIALRAMHHTTSPVNLSIYGPVGDLEHWQRCQELIETLPAHADATWHGEIANDDAPAALAAHDLFVMPSLSENFGHAIFEALASGTPVIIGDKTPWRGLAAIFAGWDLAVGDHQAIAHRIDAFAQMSSDEQLAWRKGAREKARSWAQSNDSARQMSALFQRLIDKDAV